MSQDDDIVDATGDNLEEVPGPLPEKGDADPTMSVVLALENELQQVYSDNPQKLNEANKLLRKSHNRNKA